MNLEEAEYWIKEAENYARPFTLKVFPSESGFFVAPTLANPEQFMRYKARSIPEAYKRFRLSRPNSAPFFNPN